MADRSSKLPIPWKKSSPGQPQEWLPLEILAREIDRLFEDFGDSFLQGSLFDSDALRGGQSVFPAMPAVDVKETDAAYEIAAEMPGMDENSVEVKIADGVLSISGAKQDERREENKDYIVRARSFGAFQRIFQIPDDVDADRIEATFKSGVLSVTLPKRAASHETARRIGKSFNV
jgi:HSP20 family protein